MSNRDICDRVAEKGYGKERIIADSAEPKSNDELRFLGLRIQPAAKGRDSILNGIQYIQDYRIVIHPRCVHFASEISSYTWDKDKEGNQINKPIDDNNHLMDAMRYALEPYIRRRVTDPPPKGGVPRPALQREICGEDGMYEHSHSIDSGRRMDSGGVFMRPCRGPGEGPPEDGKAGKNPARRENNRHSAGGKGPAGMAEFFNLRRHGAVRACRIKRPYHGRKEH